MADKEFKKKVEIIIWLMVICTLILGSLNAPSWVSMQVQGLFVSALLGVITSHISARIVEKAGGDSLKYWFFNIEIGGGKFSISAFVIATAIVKFVLFK